MSRQNPTPLFDSLSYELVNNISSECFASSPTERKDYKKIREFLLSYKGSEATYNAYRREIERFFHWCQLRSKKSLIEITRPDVENYLAFCQKPLKSWIGLNQVPRFIEKNGQRIPNQKWKPFVVSLPKRDTKNFKLPKIEDYQLSERSLKEIFTALSSFYNFLIQENYFDKNPILQIRQKSKYFTKKSQHTIIRRLSELQWGYLIETAELMTEENQSHERTLFIISALYGLYLRISELTASERWVPMMGHFFRDADGLWWFKTVGKGNKERIITVSTAMMKALKRYRKSLELPSLPALNEQAPLLPKNLGPGAISSSRYIRQLAQTCFDKTIERLKKDNFFDEAEQLMNATVHWLRHTGISDDVKIRPREHVRDDAGHSSSAITDKYIDIELRDRHRTGKQKKLKPEWLEQS